MRSWRRVLCMRNEVVLGNLDTCRLSLLALVGQVIDKASGDSSETSVRLLSAQPRRPRKADQVLQGRRCVGDVLSPKMSHPWSKQALKQNNSVYDQQLLAATSCSNFLQQLFMISFFAVQILGFISWIQLFHHPACATMPLGQLHP